MNRLWVPCSKKAVGETFEGVLCRNTEMLHVSAGRPWGEGGVSEPPRLPPPASPNPTTSRGTATARDRRRLIRHVLGWACASRWPPGARESPFSGLRLASPGVERQSAVAFAPRQAIRDLLIPRLLPFGRVSLRRGCLPFAVAAAVAVAVCLPNIIVPARVTPKRDTDRGLQQLAAAAAAAIVEVSGADRGRGSREAAGPSVGRALLQLHLAGGRGSPVGRWTVSNLYSASSWSSSASRRGTELSGWPGTCTGSKRPRGTSPRNWTGRKPGSRKGAPGLEHWPPATKPGTRTSAARDSEGWTLT